MKCFYHSGDLDGKCSAAIIKSRHPECELIGINYGWPFPWEKVQEGELVFMADFCLEPFDQMCRLKEMCDLVWLEHHAKSLQWRDEVNCGEWAGIQRGGIGACVLCWEWCYPDHVLPRAVKLLGLHDVWDHSDPDTEPFQYGMRSIANDPEADCWPILLNNDIHFLTSLIESGKPVVEYIKKDFEIRAKVLSFVTPFEGMRLLAANYGPGNSTVFDSVWDPDKHDAMCLFYWKPKIAKWYVTMYHPPGVGPNLGDVAEKYGGGGHEGAAGFQCEELPFHI